MAECKRSTAATLYPVQRLRTRKLLSSPFIRRPLPSPYSSRSEDSSFRQISKFRGRRSRSRGDSSPLKIESFLEMIEQDETPRAAAPVRGGAGSTSKWFISGGCVGEGRQGQTRLPRETSSNSSPSRMEIPEGRVRSNRWARRGGGESCVVIRGKRARARMRVREVTC